MEWIKPNTIRIVLPKGMIISSTGSGRFLRLEGDLAVDVEVDEGGLRGLAICACRNESRKAMDGPLIARLRSEVRLYGYEEKVGG